METAGDADRDAAVETISAAAAAAALTLGEHEERVGRALARSDAASPPGGYSR